MLLCVRCAVIAMVIALFEGRLWSTALMIKGGLGKGKHSLGEKTPHLESEEKKRKTGFYWGACACVVCLFFSFLLILEPS